MSGQDAHGSTEPGARNSTWRGLGRGIVVGSTIAVLGIAGSGAAAATTPQTATVAWHTGQSSTDVVKPSPTSLDITSRASVAVRGGRLVAVN